MRSRLRVPLSPFACNPPERLCTQTNGEKPTYRRRVGDYPDKLINGKEAGLVEPRNPTALAQVLARALDMSAGDAAAVRRAARERAAAAFDVSVVVPKTLAFYADVIETFRRSQ